MSSKKVCIRYFGTIIGQKSLDDQSKTYLIGRDRHADIRLTQEFISRRHGEVFFDDGSWWYRDLRDDHPKKATHPWKISDDQIIPLHNDVDLVTDSYLHEEVTDVRDLGSLSKAIRKTERGHKRLTYFTRAIVACLVLFAGGFGVYQLTRPLDANSLLSFVRPKVVEFEQIRNDQVIEELKKYAKLKDKDFKEHAGFCSGFIVAPKVVLTANHCLFGPSGFYLNKKFYLRTDDNKQHTVSRVLGFNVKRDYLFLEVPSLEGYESLEMASGYKIGQKVFTIGNVAGQGIAIRDGIAASKTKDPNHPEIEFLRYSAAASPGNSGGPLVDAHGQVVGLVFAKTSAENYNLATDYEHLKKGMDTYVTDLSTKNITYRTKDSMSYSFQQLQNLFYFQRSNRWFEYPETIKPLDDLHFDISVPAELESLSQKIFPPLHDAYDQAQKKIIKTLATKDEFLSTWNDQVDKKFPVLVGSDIELKSFPFIKATKNDLVARSFRIYTPAREFDYKETRKKLTNKKQYNYSPVISDILLPRSANEKLKDFRFGAREVGDKLSLYSLTNSDFYIRHVTAKKANWAKARVPDKELSHEILFGKDGLIIDFLNNAFIRPKSFKPFTLNEFPNESQKTQITDALGRKWAVEEWPLFEDFKLRQHCLPLPQGLVCETSVSYLFDEVADELSYKNYVTNYLSELIFESQFFRVDALMDYQKNVIPQNPMIGWRDIDLKLSRNETRLELKTLGLEFSFSKKNKPKYLRVIPAYVQQGDQKKWVALGFQGYFTKGKKRQICGADVEILKTETSLALKRHKESRRIASVLSRRKKPKDRKPSSKLQDLAKVKKLNSSRWGEPVTVASYCYDVEEEAVANLADSEYAINNDLQYVLTKQKAKSFWVKAIK